MKNIKRAMWAISFAALAGTAVVLGFMPERVPMHYDIAGNIDRWGSKYENLIFPVIILLLALVWSLFIRYFDKKALEAKDDKDRAGAQANAKVFAIVGLGMAAMFTVMQGFILNGSYKEAVSGATKEAVDISKLACILFGVLLIVCGNFMTKTRTNNLVGLRIKWSMYNDNTWRESNRFGAFAIIIAGLLTIIASVFMKSGTGVWIVALGLLAAASIASVVYAHRVYTKEISAENGGTKI